jgi:hypothetical protein
MALEKGSMTAATFLASRIRETLWKERVIGAGFQPSGGAGYLPRGGVWYWRILMTVEVRRATARDWSAG